MKHPSYPPQVGTIGDIIAGDRHMRIYCSARIDGEVCGHNAPVDLEALVKRYGADLRVADFVAMSRCGKCGARYPDLSVQAPPNHTEFSEWARPKRQSLAP